MKVSSLALLCAFAVFAGFAQAQDVQTIAAQCTTDGTGADGVRHGCTSKTTELKAPEGFVFVERSLQGGKDSANGSEHSCHLDWSEYVEVVPGTGIEQPRIVTLYGKARSPKGHASGRGWVGCTYTVKLQKFK